MTIPNFAHFVALVFDTQAYKDLLSLAASPPFLPGFRVYLGVKEAKAKNDNKGLEYTTRAIILRGYVLNVDKIELAEQTTNIEVYSQ